MNNMKNIFNRNDPTFKLGFLIEYYENQIYLVMVKLTEGNWDQPAKFGC